MIARVASLAFWAFMAVSSLLLFPVALLVWAVTAPFDRRLRALHQFTCFWASLYSWTNPVWRVRVEGHFVVVKSDGWKVDDAVLTGVEGASLPGPVSLVDEHRASLTQPKAPTPGGTAVPWGKNRPPGTGTSFRPTVLDKPAWERHPVGKVIASIRDEIGWGGIVAILVLIAVGAAVRESWRKKSPTA